MKGMKTVVLIVVGILILASAGRVYAQCGNEPPVGTALYANRSDAEQQLNPVGYIESFDVGYMSLGAYCSDPVNTVRMTNREGHPKYWFSSSATPVESAETAQTGNIITPEAQTTTQATHQSLHLKMPRGWGWYLEVILILVLIVRVTLWLAKDQDPLNLAYTTSTWSSDSANIGTGIGVLLERIPTWTGLWRSRNFRASKDEQTGWKYNVVTILDATLETIQGHINVVFSGIEAKEAVKLPADDVRITALIKKLDPYFRRIGFRVLAVTVLKIEDLGGILQAEASGKALAIKAQAIADKSGLSINVAAWMVLYSGRSDAINNLGGVAPGARALTPTIDVVGTDNLGKEGTK